MGRQSLPAADGREALLNPALPLLLASALLFVGCGVSEDSLPYPLTITDEGVGAIRPGMAFDSSRIQSTLPGFTVDAVSRISPQKEPMILLLKRGDTPILYLLPDSEGKQILRITALSPLIKDRYDQGIGDPLRTTPSLSCKESECFYADTPGVRYTLDPAGRIREITVQKL